MDKIWKDRRRRLGLPLSFTRYSLSDDRLFRETGLLNLVEEELLLYRVTDITLRRSLWQRLFRVGTVCVDSSDKTSPHLELKSVRDPKAVKELLHEKVEAAKAARRMSALEVMGQDDGLPDPHGDA